MLEAKHPPNGKNFTYCTINQTPVWQPEKNSLPVEFEKSILTQSLAKSKFILCYESIMGKHWELWIYSLPFEINVIKGKKHAVLQDRLLVSVTHFHDT